MFRSNDVVLKPMGKPPGQQANATFERGSSLTIGRHTLRVTWLP